VLDDVSADADAAAAGDETGSNCYYQLLGEIEALQILRGHFQVGVLFN